MAKFFKNKFFDSFISILFISGIVFILDSKFKLFDVLHSSMLQNISSSYEEKKPVFDQNVESVVLLISNKFFEQEFNSISPLDKNKLNSLLTKIIDKNPKRIIFDLDISPDYDFTSKKGSISNDLYSTLKNNANSIDIVLPFYFISEAKENNSLKYRWVEDMCKNNIVFGLPFINSEIGSVLQYNKDPNHVSLISRESENNICSLILEKNIIDLEEIIKNYHINNNKFETIPVNYQKINNSTIVLDKLDDIKKYNLEGKTVFLGGGYGFDDKYITPYGEKYGVEVLNSIYYSKKYQFDKNNAILTLVIFDIVIGVLFGVFIKIILDKREKAVNEDLLMVCNFLLIFVLVFFCFISLIISAYLFHKMFLWINPVPILIGLFIDSILGLGKSANTVKGNKKVTLSMFVKAGFVLTGVYGFVNSF